MKKPLTAVIRKEQGGFSALCPEIDIASQDDTIEEVKTNLKEAVELFFECASKEEIGNRLGQESYISALEVEVAQIAAALRTRCDVDSSSKRIQDNSAQWQPRGHAE